MNKWRTDQKRSKPSRRISLLGTRERAGLNSVCELPIYYDLFQTYVRLVERLMPARKALMSSASNPRCTNFPSILILSFLV